MYIALWFAQILNRSVMKGKQICLSQTSGRGFGKLMVRGNPGSGSKGLGMKLYSETEWLDGSALVLCLQVINFISPLLMMCYLLLFAVYTHNSVWVISRWGGGLIRPDKQTAGMANSTLFFQRNHLAHVTYIHLLILLLYGNTLDIIKLIVRVLVRL